MSSTQVYSPVQARIEAGRCLMCVDAPCTCDCPSGVDARSFIRKIRFDNLDGAVRLLRSCNILAGSCAYICPTGGLCGKGCSVAGLSHPIDIAGLQRFVMEWERRVGMIEPVAGAKTGKRVAVIGSGPCGLGCAAELAIRGHIVTVYERDSVLGGMLVQCIPNFRLPREVVEFEIEFIKKLGVEFLQSSPIDNPKKLLTADFDAVFVATGLDKSDTSITGAEKEGVYGALDLLRAHNNENLPDLGKRVIVIGGGDTALDAARVAKRSGAESLVLYRRTQGEMPAYKPEIYAAWEEGVEFYFRTIVRSVIGSNNVEGVKCIRVRWHEKKGAGLPIIMGKAGYDVEGKEFEIGCDTLVLAMGQAPSDTFDLRTTPKGFIAVDKDTSMTSEKGIFAAGDVAFGGGTATRAVGLGKNAAVEIDKYVTRDS